MILKRIVFYICIFVFALFMVSVVASPVFNSWENKNVAEYYIEKGFDETMSANLVSSIVWDFRGFDTLGEETVLFTAAVGVFTIFVLGFKIRKEAK